MSTRHAPVREYVVTNDRFAITRTVQGWDNTFLQNFCDFLLIVTPNQTTNLTCATSLLFTTSLNTFWKHRDELSKILEEKLPALANLRMKYFEALSTEFTETAIGQPLLTIGVMLESLASLSDLLRLLPSEAECKDFMLVQVIHADRY